MSTPEAHHSNPNVIRGLHNEVVFANHDGRLEEFLQTAINHHSLYTMLPEGLAYPIVGASIDIMGHSDEEMDMQGTIEFNPEAVNVAEPKDWQVDIRQAMESILEESGHVVYDLPHEYCDFYVKLDDVHCAHVQFTSDTGSCYVSVSLVNLERLSRASGYEIPFETDPEDTVIPLRIDTLKDITKLWSVAADTVADQFGIVGQEQKPAHRVVIAPPSADNGFNYFSAGTSIVPYIDGEPSQAEPYPEREAVSREGLSTIGGLTSVKNQLLDIAQIARDPIGARLYGVKGRHFVIHGPAGTGKSSVIKALAVEIDAELKTVMAADLVDKWVGNSAKNVVKLFQEAKKRPRTERIIIFFDEFEGIGSKGNTGTKERVDLKKQLNLSIEEVSRDYPNIIVAAATNADVEDLEPSLVRAGRLEPIGAGLPNEEERIDVWSAVLTASIMSFHGDRDPNASDNQPFIPYEYDVDPIELARMTDGMTGADFDLILARARMKHFRQFRLTQELTRVSQADLIEQIRTFGR